MSPDGSIGLNNAGTSRCHQGRLELGFPRRADSLLWTQIAHVQSSSNAQRLGNQRLLHLPTSAGDTPTYAVERRAFDTDIAHNEDNLEVRFLLSQAPVPNSRCQCMLWSGPSVFSARSCIHA